MHETLLCPTAARWLICSSSPPPRCFLRCDSLSNSSLHSWTGIRTPCTSGTLRGCASVRWFGLRQSNKYNSLCRLGGGKGGEAEGFVPFNFEQTRLGPWLCSFARHQFSHVTLNIPNFLICLRQQSDMLRRRMILIFCILTELERGPLLLKGKKILSSTCTFQMHCFIHSRHAFDGDEWRNFNREKNNSELAQDGVQEPLVVVGFYFPLCVSGGCVIATFLPPTRPSRWIMPGSKRTCVDLWSGLTSSSHVCKWAWLGHCMTMWPCCRFITFFFSSPVLSSQWRLFFPPDQSFLFAKKKKEEKTWREHSEVSVAMHIR